MLKFDMRKIILSLVMAAVSATAFAHVSERSVDPVSRHGGLAKRIGQYNLEIVANQRQLQLYVYSQGNRPLDTHRSSAELRIMHSGGTTDVQLSPSGGNRLASDWQAPQSDSVWAVLTLSIYGRKPVKRLVSAIPIHPDSAATGEKAEENRGALTEPKRLFLN